MTGIIEEWRVREYEKNIYHLVQQKDMRMAGHAVWGMQNSKIKAYDRLGTAEWLQRTGRYGDTPNLEIDHSRRNVVMTDWEWGKLIDDTDTLRTLNDPMNPYAKAAAYGAKRRMDKIFRDAALGTALTGEDADGTQALPNTQKIASVDSGAFDFINVETLRLASYYLNKEEVDVEETRYIAMNARQLRALLEKTEITSSDYNTVKALTRGEVDTFLGLKFILISARDEGGLPNDGTDDTGFVWHKRSIGQAIGMDLTTEVEYSIDYQGHIAGAKFSSACAVIDDKGIVGVISAQ